MIDKPEILLIAWIIAGVLAWFVVATAIVRWLA